MNDFNKKYHSYMTLSILLLLKLRKYAYIGVSLYERKLTTYMFNLLTILTGPKGWTYLPWIFLIFFRIVNYVTVKRVIDMIQNRQ